MICVKNFFGTIATFFLDVLETVVIALSIFVVVYLIAFQPHEVNGKSMDGIAQFHNGQFILTDKLTYRFRDPKRAEVIVFAYPLKKSDDYIKRIIALPGEQIMVSNNKVYIFNSENKNGVILNESEYLSPLVVTKGKEFLKEGEKITVPANNYFVMGDNRPDSSDSRSWGFVPREDIIGKSFFRYWPPNEIGLIKTPKVSPFTKSR